MKTLLLILFTFSTSLVYAQYDNYWWAITGMTTYEYLTDETAELRRYLIAPWRNETVHLSTQDLYQIANNDFIGLSTSRYSFVASNTLNHCSNGAFQFAFNNHQFFHENQEPDGIPALFARGWLSTNSIILRERESCNRFVLVSPPCAYEGFCVNDSLKTYWIEAQSNNVELVDSSSFYLPNMSSGVCAIYNPSDESYWIIGGIYQTNQIFVISSLYLHDIENHIQYYEVGPVFQKTYSTMSDRETKIRSSKDGSYFSISTHTGSLGLYHFDIITGEITGGYDLTKDIPYSRYYATEFSARNNHLYVQTSSFSLNEQNIPDSIHLLQVVFDKNTLAPTKVTNLGIQEKFREKESSEFSDVYCSELKRAPDGRIFLFSTHKFRAIRDLSLLLLFPTGCLSAIHEPEELGQAANLEYCSFQLPGKDDFHMEYFKFIVEPNAYPPCPAHCDTFPPPDDYTPLPIPPYTPPSPPADISQIPLPTAFSPNSDGLNDRWPGTIAGGNGLTPPDGTQGTVQIFSRWGTLVYSGPLDPGWDGRAPSGAPAPEGVYMYVYRSPSGQQRTGSITLVR